MPDQDCNVIDFPGVVAERQRKSELERYSQGYSWEYLGQESHVGCAGLYCAPLAPGYSVWALVRPGTAKAEAATLLRQIADLIEAEGFEEMETILRESGLPVNPGEDEEWRTE